VTEGGLWHSARGWARAASPQPALVNQNHIGAALRGFDGRHAGSQAAADDQHVTVKDLSGSDHGIVSLPFFLAVVNTTLIASSGHTSSQRKQFTQYLLP
jgi:hypothetical protein